jgi:hypothetical protein
MIRGDSKKAYRRARTSADRTAAIEKRFTGRSKRRASATSEIEARMARELKQLQDAIARIR